LVLNRFKNSSGVSQKYIPLQPEKEYIFSFGLFFTFLKKPSEVKIPVEK